MTDWTKQVSEFQHSWMEQQQKFLSDWLGTMQKAGGATGPQNAWEQTISVMERQVDGTLDMQKHSLMSIARNMEHVEGVPEAYKQWVQQLEEGVEMWADMQHRLWEVWFDMLHSVEPATQSPGEGLVKDWEDMARRAMSVQKQWLSDWTDAGAGASSGGAAGGKSRKPVAAKRSAAKSREGGANEGDS